MESDTCYGDFMVKLIWKLSGNLIYHAFSMKPNTPFQKFVRNNGYNLSLESTR